MLHKFRETLFIVSEMLSNGQLVSVSDYPVSSFGRLDIAIELGHCFSPFEIHSVFYSLSVSVCFLDPDATTTKPCSDSPLCCFPRFTRSSVCLTRSDSGAGATEEAFSSKKLVVTHCILGLAADHSNAILLVTCHSLELSLTCC